MGFDGSYNQPMLHWNLRHIRKDLVLLELPISTFVILFKSYMHGTRAST